MDWEIITNDAVYALELAFFGVLILQRGVRRNPTEWSSVMLGTMLLMVYLFFVTRLSPIPLLPW